MSLILATLAAVTAPTGFAAAMLTLFGLVFVLSYAYHRIKDRHERRKSRR